MADLTVAVPTRNRCAVARQTIRAILDQRDVDLRLVVVDEGSTDETPAMLASLAAADPRLTFVRHDPAKGLAAARNAGLERADTPWVAFCDDDDIWAPDKAAAQLAAIAATPGARWSCTGTISIAPCGDVVGHQHPPASGDVSTLLRMHNAVPGGGSSLLAETSLVREVGGYDAWCTGCEDFEMAMKLALRAPVAAVDRPLVAYRVWPGSMSTNVAKMRTGHERAVERWRGELDPALAREGDLVKESYLGRFHLRNGDRFAAAAHYARMAVRYRLPRQLAGAGAALVAPHRLAARHDAREVAGVPQAWIDEARPWIAASMAAAEAVSA